MRKMYVTRLGVTVMTATMLVGQVVYANADLNMDSVQTKTVDYKAYAGAQTERFGAIGFDGLDIAAVEKKAENIMYLKNSSDSDKQAVSEISDNAVAGMALTVNDYYDAVYSGEVSENLVLELESYTSEETAKKLEAFGAYNNLGIANVDTYLNVRDKAGKSGNIIGKMVGNSACEILELSDGWYHIQSGPVDGYVSAEYIVTGDEAKSIAVKEATLRAIVNTSVLNVRKAPNTDSEIVEKVGNDERYSVLEVLDGWVKISIDGEEGYVSDEYVDVRYALLEAVEFSPADSQSSFRSSVVDYALQFLGNPYVWGGSSLTRGTDCSGFTMSVYRYFGIGLSHSSRAQANEGRAISASELRPGDLVFYGGGTINHVALYIGNGKIIHASDETTGIIISRYNNRTPVKCVNVIGD